MPSGGAGTSLGRKAGEWSAPNDVDNTHLKLRMRPGRKPDWQHSCCERLFLKEVFIEEDEITTKVGLRTQ